MRKKIIFLFILMFLFFEGYHVYAACYEVRNVHSYKLIEYTSNNTKYNDSTLYKVEPVKESYCSKSPMNPTNKITCGKLGTFNKKIPEITSWIVTIVEILVPVLLVIFGAIDFVKAVSAQKEDEIKKGQQTFIKRLIVAVLIFFVVAITKLLVSLVSGSDGEKDSILSCIDCFISYKCN